MKRIILGLAAGLVLAMGGIGEGLAKQPNEMKIKEIFANAILMTTEDCGKFGTGWKRYEAISGRFALASGEGHDQEEIKAFTVNGKGGKYRHILTVEEMPQHEHKYDKTSKDHTGRSVADYGDDQRNSHKYNPLSTGLTGGGNPHNNMPPYLVLNFCHFNPKQ